MEDLKPYIQLLLPGHCYETFLVDLNFFDAPCWRAFISKGLGYSIILGALLVKLPQIVKILQAKSGAGLSIPSIFLELTAITISVAYAVNAGFPFSAYGDSTFLLAQSSLVAILVMLFSGNMMLCLAYVVVHSAILWYLLSGLAPADFLWALQTVNMPIIAGSKMVQAFENYKNGSTGQLSAVTVFMLFAGAAARIFTSYQETGDLTLILTYVVATVCNGILFAQVLIYWNVDSKDKKKKKA